MTFEAEHLLGLHDEPDACCALCDRDTRIAELERERDKAIEDYHTVVAKVAENRLDGYRELGARAARAENDCDTLRGKLKKVMGAVEEAYNSLLDVELSEENHDKLIDAFAVLAFVLREQKGK